ncbi:putative serine dehydratase domain-containing protein [Bombardia bombarda]|uniref:D-serine dehydratase n=1 Tax=Bombardia bombarda TaxID=252184 RepID=A0AA39WZR5_9PEZI|nr:putative serine dehydratase domain-containing protein [Bombardia bombarda]
MANDLKEQLRAKFVGQTLSDVDTPRVVLDLAKLDVNCVRMLDATDRLGLQWRAHIKSHKTTELTRLQVGNEQATPVRLIVSTIVEAENILPLLKEYQSKGRHINLLFSFPLFASAVARLAHFSSQLGPSSLSVMIDHPDQLELVAAIRQSSGHPPDIFIKMDVGSKRAGVVMNSPAYSRLLDAVLSAEAAGSCHLHGLYAHAGHSYSARNGWKALQFLASEFTNLKEAATLVRSKSPDHPLVLSVGATPTATTIQNPNFFETDKLDGPTRDMMDMFADMKTSDFVLEVHAGVYPTLDLQQLATHARDSSLMTADDIAISVLAEVASVYPERGDNGTTQALINAGVLALGREPVEDVGPHNNDASAAGKGYSSWGIAMPWDGLDNNPAPGPDFPQNHGGWQVGKISQEHGILVWKGNKQNEVPLHVGQRVRIWPNHSCIAGACFDSYLIVDSRNKARPDEIVDVWPRWRGW